MVYKNTSAFTIVELLIVIVIIGILAAITIVSYSAIQQKATVALLASDLSNASKQLKMFQVENNSYPNSVTDCPTPSIGNMCLKTSDGNNYTSIQTDSASSSQTFCLNIKRGNSRYRVTNNSVPELGTCLGVTDGLIAYYPFDIDAKDYSGNNKDGSVIGAGQTSGIYNLAYGFNGSSTYINLPSDLGYTNSVSAFAWFKVLGTPGNSFHIIFGGQELEISIPTSGVIRTGVYTNARFVSNHGSGLLDGNWHFVGFTFDGSTKKSYIDGINVGELAVTGTLTGTFSNRRIGVYGSTTTYYANGIIDDARIYNRALSPGEVSTLYNL